MLCFKCKDVFEGTLAEWPRYIFPGLPSVVSVLFPKCLEAFLKLVVKITLETYHLEFSNPSSPLLSPTKSNADF